MTDPFEQAARAERERQHRRRRDVMRASVRVHTAVFICIQLLLATVWALTGAAFPWFLFPLLGWGALLAGHAVVGRESRRIFADDEP